MGADNPGMDSRRVKYINRTEFNYVGVDFVSRMIDRKLAIVVKQ